MFYCKFYFSCDRSLTEQGNMKMQDRQTQNLDDEGPLKRLSQLR